MTDRELMQQALEALENFARFQRMMMDGPDVSDKLLAEDYAEAGFLQGAKTITALRERLAQPEQDQKPPVKTYCGGKPNYCTPEWVGLTDEAIWLEYQRFWPFHPADEPRLAQDIAKFARAIEAKLKKKNDQSIVSGS